MASFNVILKVTLKLLMFVQNQTLKSSDLRKHTHEVLEELAQEDDPVMVFSRSKPTGVVLMSVKTLERYKSRAESGPKSSLGIDFFIDTPDLFKMNAHGKSAAQLVREMRD